MPALSAPPRGVSFVLAAASVLAGCAQPPAAPIRDHAPESGPYAARLLVRGGLQPKDTYGLYLFDGAQQCVGARRLSVGNSESTAPSTLLRAERLATVQSFILTAERKTCGTVLSFLPRTGRTYVLTVRNDGKSCWTELYDATDPDNVNLELTVRRRDGGGQFCRPLAASVGLPAADAATPSPGAGTATP